MKKATYIIFFMVLLVLLSACNRQSDSGEPQSTEGTSEIYVKGLENVDVLNSHGSIEGLERMSSFYDNVQNGVPVDLRIVHYTIEGDPIVTDVSYNGEFLEVKDDTTRDSYGSGEITSNHCANLIEEVNPTNTSYIAVDCTDSLHGLERILQINYNMSQQDLFEFVLKYGTNEEYEIDSRTRTLKKESNESGTQIATDVKQEVYKRLVFANYLAEKNLITTCDTEDTMNYFLKVYINGGEREFQWSACDQSKDGVKFTKIANYIIEQSEKKQHVQQPITVQGYVLEKKDNELLVGEELTMLDYELMKGQLQQIDFDSYIFDFTILIGVNTEEFNPVEKSWQL